jgi:hypothetical protein
MDLIKSDKGMAVVICGCIMATSSLVYGMATGYRVYRGRGPSRYEEGQIHLAQLADKIIKKKV